VTTTYDMMPPLAVTSGWRLVRLLAAVAIGPTAWIAQLLVGYGLSSAACFPDDKPLLHAPPQGWTWETPGLLGINLFCLVLALVGAAAGWLVLRRGGVRLLEEDARLSSPAGRDRFLALCATMAGVAFAIAILFDTAPILGVPTCWRVVG